MWSVVRAMDMAERSWAVDDEKLKAGLNPEEDDGDDA
jgi:hypothetical protein